MVDDAGAQGEASMNGGVGDEDPSAALDAVEDLQVEIVQLGSSSSKCDRGTNRKQTALSGTGAISSSSGDWLRRARARCEASARSFSICSTKGVEAVIAQRKPELQGAEAARKFERLVEKREALDGIFEQRLGIVAGEGEGPAGRWRGRDRAGIRNRAAGRATCADREKSSRREPGRRKEPGERWRRVLQKRRRCGTMRRRTFAMAASSRERVDAAGGDGAGGTDDGDGSVPGATVVVDRLTKKIGAHAEVVVARNRGAGTGVRVPTAPLLWESTCVPGRRRRRFRAVDMPDSFGGMSRLARHGEAHEVGGGASASEAAHESRQPIASASQSITTCSMVAAAGPERHAVTFWLRTLASRSAAAAIGSPEPRTYPKKRGLGRREASITACRSSRAAAPSPLLWKRFGKPAHAIPRR